MKKCQVCFENKANFTGIMCPQCVADYAEQEHPIDVTALNNAPVTMSRDNEVLMARPGGMHGDDEPMPGMPGETVGRYYRANTHGDNLQLNHAGDPDYILQTPSATGRFTARPFTMADVPYRARVLMDERMGSRHAQAHILIADLIGIPQGASVSRTAGMTWDDFHDRARGGGNRGAGGG